MPLRLTPVALPEFLLARIAEDEAVAASALGDTDELGHWHARHYDCEGINVSRGSDREARERYIGPIPQRVPPMALVSWCDETTDQITRWSPARVVAECKAKRKIVSLHLGRDGMDCGFHCRNGTCSTLAALAAPYVDHPDYRPEWSPDA